MDLYLDSTRTTW